MSKDQRATEVGHMDICGKDIPGRGNRGPIHEQLRGWDKVAKGESGR